MNTEKNNYQNMKSLEYYYRNRTMILEKCKIRRQQNLQQIREYNRNYYHNHYKQQSKLYRANNIDRIKQYGHQYYYNHVQNNHQRIVNRQLYNKFYYSLKHSRGTSQFLNQSVSNEKFNCKKDDRKTTIFWN